MVPSRPLQKKQSKSILNGTAHLGSQNQQQRNWLRRKTNISGRCWTYKTEKDAYETIDATGKQIYGFIAPIQHWVLLKLMP
jgi:hypothetical protein